MSAPEPPADNVPLLLAERSVFKKFTPTQWGSFLQSGLPVTHDEDDTQAAKFTSLRAMSGGKLSGLRKKVHFRIKTVIKTHQELKEKLKALKTAQKNQAGGAPSIEREQLDAEKAWLHWMNSIDCLEQDAVSNDDSRQDERKLLIQALNFFAISDEDDMVKFLQALSVKLPIKVDMRRDKHVAIITNLPPDNLREEISKYIREQDESLEHDLLYNASPAIEHHCFWIYSRYAFLVDGLGKLDDGRGAYHETLIAMYLSRNLPSEGFNTPLLLAMIGFHWNLVLQTFLLDKAIDFAIIGCLVSVAWSSHARASTQPLVLMVLSGLGMWPFISHCITLVMCIAVFQKSPTMLYPEGHPRKWYTRLWEPVRPLVSPWACVNFAVDMITMTTFLFVAWNDVSSHREIVQRHGFFMQSFEYRKISYKDSFLFEHPVLTSFIIVMKWLHFLMTLLNFEQLGTRMLPTYLAAMSHESITFLMYMIGLIMAFTHAYYAFPLGHVVHADVLDSMTYMYRMIMVGDFAAEELEGSKQDWVDEFSQNGTTVGVGEEFYEKFDFGIKVFTVIGLMIGPVFFLNAYIGLLSNVYNKIQDDISAHFGRFRVATMLPYLFRRRFRRKFFGCFDDSCCCASPSGNVNHGYLVLIPSDKVEAAEEESFNMQEEVTQLREDVRTMMPPARGSTT